MVGPPIYLVTACTSGEEFVAAFRRYADKGGIFVPIAEPLPANRRGRFAMTLKDGSVMLEGEAEIVASSKSPSPLYGRVGMTVKFVEPDDASKTLLTELDRARLSVKVTAPSVAPRPAEVPATPRAQPPAIAGRIDAANALAESVVIGDLALLKDLGPPKAGPKFVIPSIPTGPRPKTPSAFPIVEARTPSERSPVNDTLPTPNKPIGDTMPPPAFAPQGTRPKSASIPPMIPKSKDTQPSMVVPPPKPDQNERRVDRSASLPQLQDLKVGNTQAVAVVPPPAQMFAAKNLFDDVDAVDTDTSRSVPAGGDDSGESRPVDPPKPLRTAMQLAIKPAPEIPNDTEDEVAPPPVGRAPESPALTITAVHASPPPVAATATIEMSAVPEPLGFMADSGGSPASPIQPIPTAPVVPDSTSLAALVKAAAMKAKRVDSNPTIRGTAPAPVKTPGPEMVTPAAPIVARPAPKLPPVALENDEPTDLTEMPSKSIDTVDIATVDISTEELDALPTTTHASQRPTIEEPTPSGDWTMTLDGPIQTQAQKQPRAGTAPVAEGDDWTITPDMAAPEGYDTPAKAEAAAAPKPMAAKPASAPVSKPKSVPAKTKAFKALDLAPQNAPSVEPKVQIDPTLMEPLTPMPQIDDDPFLGDAPFSPHRSGTENGLGGPMVPPAPSAPMAAVAPPLFAPPAAPMVAISMMQQQPPVPMQPQQPPPMQPHVPFGPPTPIPTFAPPMNLASATGSNAVFPGDSAPMLPPQDSTSMLNIGKRRRLTVIIVSAIAVVVLGVVITLILMSRKDTAPASGIHDPAVKLGGSAGSGGGSSVAATGSDGSASGSATDGSAGSGDGSAIAASSGSNGSNGKTDGSAGKGSATKVVDPNAKCTLEIVSSPAGADIIDAATNRSIGSAPKTIEAPCGTPMKLELRKAGYSSAQRTATPTPEGTKVRAALARPLLTVKVSSTPSGASITVGGKAQGVTPTIVKLPAYEQSKVVFSKEGFASESETITPKTANQSLHTTLKKKKR